MINSTLHAAISAWLPAQAQHSIAEPAATSPALLTLTAGLVLALPLVLSLVQRLLIPAQPPHVSYLPGMWKVGWAGRW
jgi:hypothetical protein